MAALVMMIYLLESLFSTAWSLVWKQTGFRELEAKYWPKAAGGKHAPLGCVVGKRRNDPSSRENMRNRSQMYPRPDSIIVRLHWMTGSWGVTRSR